MFQKNKVFLMKKAKVRNKKCLVMKPINFMINLSLDLNKVKVILLKEARRGTRKGN